MAGKKAAMTPAQIRAAGYVIEQYVPVLAGAQTRGNPWVLHRIGTLEGGTRFATRDEAIVTLQYELDGVPWWERRG